MYNGKLLNSRDAGRKETTLSLKRRGISSEVNLLAFSSSGQPRAIDIPKARNVCGGNVMHGFRVPNAAYLVGVVVSIMQLYAGTP